MKCWTGRHSWKLKSTIKISEFSCQLVCRYYVPCSRALINPPKRVMSPHGTKPEAAKLALAKTLRLPVPLPAPPVSLAKGQKLM